MDTEYPQSYSWRTDLWGGLSISMSLGLHLIKCQHEATRHVDARGRMILYFTVSLLEWGNAGKVGYLSFASLLVVPIHAKCRRALTCLLCPRARHRVKLRRRARATVAKTDPHHGLQPHMLHRDSWMHLMWGLESNGGIVRAIISQAARLHLRICEFKFETLTS